MRVVHGKGYGFAAEPVADVIRVAVDKRDPHAIVQDVFEVGFELGVDEVAGVAEAFEDEGGGGGGVVEVDAEGLLGGGLVEEVDEVCWGGGVFVGVSDVVDAAAGIGVVGAFDEVAADGCGLGAGGLAVDGRAVD